MAASSRPALKAFPQASPCGHVSTTALSRRRSIELRHEYAAMMTARRAAILVRSLIYVGWCGSRLCATPTKACGNPTWNDYVALRITTSSGSANVIPLTSMKVPTLGIPGWWDQEDFYGPVAIYDALREADTQGIFSSSTGAGGWSGTGDSQHSFGSNTAESRREKIRRRSLRITRGQRREGLCAGHRLRQAPTVAAGMAADGTEHERSVRTQRTGARVAAGKRAGEEPRRADHRRDVTIRCGTENAVP